MDLDRGWAFHGSTDTTWLPASVPGTVHTDLLAAGRIPDPLRGVVEDDLQWIGEETWTYRTTFQVDPRLLAEDRLELVFDGLDTYADVTLNGAPVLSADNMFRAWRVDVGDALRGGANTLEVRFSPAVARGAARAAAHPWPIPHQEPDPSATRAFSRKAAYQYGWDWGPRYVTAGIWKAVRLEAWSGTRVTNVSVASVAVTGDTVEAELVVELEAAGPGTARVGIRSDDGAFDAMVEDLDIPAPGRATLRKRIHIPGGELWWPRGAGRGAPHLYGVAVDAVQGRRWDRRHARVGLRTVALDTTADAAGRRFRFAVNGRPVFARGANLIPPSPFPAGDDSASYARIVDDAVAANMNMLRVWGGGVYPPDVFYDLADAAGIMVWQDFMFANNLVPGDSAFAASVAAEARDQVRRLHGHPSLTLWCGNNEVAEGWANWGWRDGYTEEVARDVEAAYDGIFHGVLPAAVGAGSPDVPYWPSSPSVGWGHPESLTRGDSHYWGVWWGMEPFRVYARKVPRFASEYGFQALPDPATVSAFGTAGGGTSSPVDRDAGARAEAGGDASGLSPRALSDALMKAHQKHPTGFETLRAYLGRDWPVPADDDLDGWSYLTQLAQAEGVGLALEAHRRAWPYTGGTLFWQLNDTWPVVSWSSVDAEGRWKALHYRAARVFAPVAVLADAWADTVAVWVASDPATEGTLTIRLRRFSGEVLAEQSVPVVRNAAADAGSPQGHPDWRATAGALLPSGADPRTVFVDARFHARSTAEARDVAFLVPPGELALSDPGLRVVSARPGESEWNVALTAERLAFAVRVSVEGVDARFSDNYVHVAPGDTVEIRVTPASPTPDLPRRIRLRSLAHPRPGGGGP